MTTPRSLLDSFGDQPLRTHPASGNTFDVRQSISLTLMVSISHLEAPVSS